MASVVRQNLSMDFGGRFQVVPFPITTSPDRAERRLRRVLRHLAHLRHLGRRIAETRARIVHIHTCSGFSFFRSLADLVVARRNGCRTILHIHGAAFDEFHEKSGSTARRLIAWGLSRADRIVVLSRSWREKIERMAPKAAVTVVENAVDLPKVSPSVSSDGPCRFLLLARMDEWKGIDDLLAASAILVERRVAFELVLAGPEGTAGNGAELRRKIDEAGLHKHVQYLGAILGGDKTDRFAWANVYVQPSHHEGMPISMLEALAQGLPVVATRVGAVPEVITEGRQGLLVDPHKPSRLADAMETLARDREMCRTMATAARALARERFGPERFESDLASVYEGLLTRRCDRGGRAHSDAKGLSNPTALSSTR